MHLARGNPKLLPASALFPDDSPSSSRAIPRPRRVAQGFQQPFQLSRTRSLDRQLLLILIMGCVRPVRRYAVFLRRLLACNTVNPMIYSPS
jgi:hypothetical protein